MEKLLKKYQLEWMDVLYLVVMTAIGLAIRGILRVVTTVDWEMYWDPWISDLKEMGFSYLATDRYDYAPSFVYILWVISKLPINPMTAYKAIHITLDFVAAAVMGRLVMETTGSKIKSFCSYGLMLLVPTIWADSALWAQCDIIFMLFILLCFYYLFQEMPNRAMFFYGLAFVFKLQSLFIFPFLVILWVNRKIKIQHFLWIPGSDRRLVLLQFLWLYADGMAVDRGSVVLPARQWRGGYGVALYRRVLVRFRLQLRHAQGLV